MGGRGTSSGSKRSGQSFTRQQPMTGSAGGGASAPRTQQQTQPAQQAQPAAPMPQAPTPILPPAPTPTTLQQLSQMNDGQVTSILKAAETAKIPNHLKDRYDPTQQLIYQIGLNAPPTVMDASHFSQFMKANNISQSEVMSREVGGGKYNTTAGNIRKLTAQQVAQMWLSDPYNYIGGKHGGQALGAGAYFAMNGGRSTGYASGGVKMNAVLNPQTARVISVNKLQAQARSWARTHPKADAQIRKMARSSKASFGSAELSLYAAVLGYNVINGGGNYYNIIDRAAVVVKQ